MRTEAEIRAEIGRLTTKQESIRMEMETAREAVAVEGVIPLWSRAAFLSKISRLDAKVNALKWALDL